MTIIKIKNPFDAPVYHLETVTSTMDVSRRLAASGKPHGTVITADLQKTGRGRIDRKWQAENALNLLFTVLLRFPCIQDIPSALTLRTGLASALAIENFAPSLKNKVQVKWPNDVIINNKKVTGILCEAEDGIVHVGVGINVAQKVFPKELKNKAVSICLAAGNDISPDKRFSLLEKFLEKFYGELETKQGADWKTRLEQRLYKRGGQVTFIEGPAGLGKEIKGILNGINENGELLILPENKTKACSFISGELIL